MRNFNEHIIYKNPDVCLSEKVAERYLAGKLSEKEQAMAAQHLEHCSFCSEAIEGAALLNNPEKLSSITNEINSKVNRRSYEKPAFLGAKVAAAAVVVILFSVGIYGYLNFTNAESEMMYAENFSKYPEKLNMDSVINRMRVEEHLQEESSLPAAELDADEIVARKEVIAPEVASAAPASDDFMVASPPPPPVIEKNTSKQQSSSERASTENKSLNTGTAIEEADEVMDIEISSTKSKSDKVFESAITSYDRNQYSEAIQLFDQVKQYQKYQEQSFLYTGISYLQLGQPELAIENFDQLLEMKNSSLAETALWYKALSLIKLNKNREAKSILKKVINKDGIYKERAIRLRNSL